MESLGVSFTFKKNVLAFSSYILLHITDFQNSYSAEYLWTTTSVLYEVYECKSK